MGAAQPIAIARMLGGVCLVAEVDAEKAARRLDAGPRRPRLHRRRRGARRGVGRPGVRSTARGCASRSTPPSCSRRLLERGVTPDVVTDFTAAHDPRYGYMPVGVGLSEAEELRRSDPGKLEALALATMVRHVRAMLALRERGAVTFDYGNNIRPHAASGGLPEALTIDIFTARYIRPLFCRGIGPFRWICLSGDDADLDAIDDCAWSCSPTSSGSRRGSRSHANTWRVRGLPARIAWLGHGERARVGAGGQRGSRRRAPAGAGRVHARPHGRGGDDAPEHRQRGDGRRLGRDQRLAAAERAADHRKRRRPGRAARGRRRLRRLLAERRHDRRGDRAATTARSG